MHSPSVMLRPPLLHFCAGMFGIGGASPFLTSFKPVYVAKQIGTGFLFMHHKLNPAWSLWGVPASSENASIDCVGTLGSKPGPGVAEEAIRRLCKS